MKIDNLTKLVVILSAFCTFGVNAISQSFDGSIARPTNSLDVGKASGDQKRTEDVLKSSLLEMRGDERMESVRTLFSQPLTAEALQVTYDYVVNPHFRNPDLDMDRLVPLANFLAYVSTSYSTNVVVSAKARALFDNMASRAKGRAVYAVQQALGQYGNADLVLIPSILNTNDLGYLAICSTAIQIHGNAEVLRRLISISDTPPHGQIDIWNRGEVESRRSILVIYERLKHPNESWPTWPGCNSVRPEESSYLRAADLWFNDHHEGWSIDKLLETVKKEFPAGSTNSIVSP